MQPRQVISPVRRPIVRALFAAALAIAVTAIPAHADKGPAGDDPEDNYIFVLRSEGITFRSDSEAVDVGIGVCSNIGRGVKPRAMMAEVARLASALSSYQVEVLVDSAVTWLCPQYIRWYVANR